jgi:hypothetical protein
MLLRSLAAALFLSITTPVFAGGELQWRAVDEATGQIRDVERLEQLARDFPDSGTVRLRMLQPLLEAGETEKLLETLRWLKARGYVFGEVSQTQIPKLIGEEHAEAAKALLIPSADVIATSEVIATIPAEAGLVESVVRHPSSKMLIASSVSGQSLHVFLPSDVWANVPMPQVSDLSGIVWDPHTGMNWIASSNIDGSEDDEHVMEGLLGVLDGVQPTAFAQAPDGSKISDLAVALDGTIFASDPINGGIYAKLAGADASLEEFVPPGTFRSPQGLATSADNTKLYVSDYRYGIAIVDLETREVSRLASDIPVILDGVDGLWRYGSELIAMQSGTSPMRISAFELSEDGMRVVGHRVLEQANPDWTEPLSGSIDGDALIYVGNGQWDRYFQGELKQGMEPSPTQIRRLPLGPRTE